MIDIKVGDTWVNKLDETNTVTLETVGTFSVTGRSTKDGQYMASKDDFLHYFKPQEPTIAVDSVWRCKEDGELVYIESDDGTLCWNLNFSPLGETDMYADHTKNFLSEYEFVCDSKYDSSLAFNGTQFIGKVDTASETLNPTSAVELLETSAATLIRCGKKYDSTGNNSERVMDRIVDMFNAATGHKLTEAQGNIFMVCLKVVRSETSTYHDDDHYIDGVNYFAMAGEASSKNYKDSE